MKCPKCGNRHSGASRHGGVITTVCGNCKPVQRIAQKANEAPKTEKTHKHRNK